MGTAHVEVSAALLQRLRTDPILNDEIGIIGDPLDQGDGFWMVKVFSPLLPAGYRGTQELVVEYGKPFFKPASLNGLEQGRDPEII